MSWGLTNFWNLHQKLLLTLKDSFVLCGFFFFFFSKEGQLIDEAEAAAQGLNEEGEGRRARFVLRDEEAREGRNDLLLNTFEEFDAPLGAKPRTSPIFNISSSTPAPARKTGADDFLNSENDKNDYDWSVQFVQRGLDRILCSNT